MDREELMELAMDLGYRLQESGAEIYRVEESINRLFSAYGVQGDVFAVNNCIILTISGDGETPLTRMRRVPAHDTNLDMVEAYNAVSRKLCAETPDYAAAKELLRQPRRNTQAYSPLAVLLGAFLSAAAFCMYNQAGPLDGLWAGFCGTAAAWIYIHLGKRQVNAFFRVILASFSISILATGLQAAGVLENLEAVTIGGQLLLLPGLVFTNFIRDIINGDTNAGLSKMVEALLIAAALAGGAALALILAGRLFPGARPETVLTAHPLPLRCLFMGLTGVGVCLLYNVHGPGIILCCLAAAAGCLANLGAEALGAGIYGSSLAAAVAISAYAEIMARIRKCPAISYLVVAMYPLVPGSGLYRALTYALQGESQLFLSTALRAIAVAGCLAAGMVAVSSLVRLHGTFANPRKGR